MCVCVFVYVRASARVSPSSTKSDTIQRQSACLRRIYDERANFAFRSVEIQAFADEDDIDRAWSIRRDPRAEQTADEAGNNRSRVSLPRSILSRDLLNFR